MKIFKNIKNSIYGPKYYGDLISKPFSYSIRYYLLFSFFLSLIFIIIFSFSFFPELNLFIGDFKEKALEYYPEELEIEIKDGLVYTNVAEPYFIKNKEEFDNKDYSHLENIVVIDTINDFNIEKFYSYKTFGLLTKDSFIYFDEKEIKIRPLGDIKDFTLNKEKINYYIEVIMPYLKFIYPFFFIFFLIFWFFWLQLNLFYLFFGALLIWLIAKIKKINIGYLKSYQIGMHLMTFGIILKLILMLLPEEISDIFSFKFFFTAVLIIVTLINLRSETESFIYKDSELNQKEE